MKRSILGAMLVASLLFAGAGPAIAARQWLEIRSDNFIIYSNAREKRALKLAEDLEFFRHYLQLLTSIKSTTTTLPLTVYAFRKIADFTAEMNMKKNVAGFYSDRPSGATAFLGLDKARSATALSGREVLFHEYVHYFLAQFSPLRYPAWYNEGIAEFYATFKRKGTSLSLGLPVNYRAPVLISYEWLPVEKLLSANRRARKEKVFYGQSWITVHYLMTKKHRFEQVNNYIKRLNLGMSYEGAFRASFDISMGQLGREVAAYWKKRKLPYLKITLPEVDYSPSFAVRKLDENEALLMLANAHLRRSTKEWDIGRAAEYVDRVREKDPANTVAISLRVEVDMARGAISKAMAVLRTMPEAERRTFRILLLEGKLLMAGAHFVEFDRADQQKIARAILLLETATKANSNSADAYFSYGKAIMMSAETNPMRALKALLKARELLPQNEEIERAYAVATMKAGYNRQAAEIFQDYLNWSPSSEVMRWAREKLAATGIDPASLHNSGAPAEDSSQTAQ